MHFFSAVVSFNRHFFAAFSALEEREFYRRWEIAEGQFGLGKRDTFSLATHDEIDPRRKEENRENLSPDLTRTKSLVRAPR